jgi:hypothetical protein
MIATIDSSGCLPEMIRRFDALFVRYYHQAKGLMMWFKKRRWSVGVNFLILNQVIRGTRIKLKEVMNLYVGPALSRGLRL